LAYPLFFRETVMCLLRGNFPLPLASRTTLNLGSRGNPLEEFYALFVRATVRLFATSSSFSPRCCLRSRIAAQGGERKYFASAA